MVTRLESMKYAVLAFGVWLSSAPAFSSQPCCSGKPAPKAACGGCGDQNESDSSSRPNCCSFLDAPTDIDITVPRSDVPQTFVVTEQLSQVDAPASRSLESADLIAIQAASRAEGPPLYLRYLVLLI
jgi:hypothetical protein